MKYASRHVCRECLDAFKRSREGKAARAAAGKWRKEMWPASVYTNSGYRHCEKHHAAALAYSSARNAAERQATPTWVDHKAIAAVFVEAIRLTRETGVRHDVDHIVPLRGKLVSGMHVPWNLQPMPAHENNRKNNRFDERLGIAGRPP